MIKIWNQAFWKAAPEAAPVIDPETPAWKLQVIPVVTLTLLIIALGLFPEPVFQLTQQAAAQLLAPLEYINIVFGGGR